MKFVSSLLFMVILLGAHAKSGVAQEPYPSKPVHMIVTVAPGGAIDTLARGIAKLFGERAGAAMIVDNRPGGANFTRAAACAKARPDGYNVCLLPRDVVSIAPFEQKLSFDPVSELAPVSLFAFADNVILANASVSANSFRELIDYARKNPGKINYTAFGASQAIMAWILQKTGTQMTFIPYRGAIDSMPAFLSGQIQVIYIALGTPGLVGEINSGKFKGLAVPGDKRNRLLPKVPSFTEVGLPDFQTRSWQGIFAPAGTPKEIVARLSAEFSAIAHDAQFGEQRLRPLGFDPVGSSPEEFASFIVLDRKAGEELAKLIGERVQ